jgi:hypothetical protein
LQDEQTGITAHLIGLFPGVGVDNYPVELKRIDAVLGDFCRFRCESRVVKDLDARIIRAFELNLDGITDRFDDAKAVISILRQKAGLKNTRRLKETGKEQDVIQHPIPISYQILIDHWQELVPSSSRGKIILYIIKPDPLKAEQLAKIYMSEGMTASIAKKHAETNQGSMFDIKNSPLHELGILEGLNLLQRAEAITILAHPAMSARSNDYDDFDRHILYPLIKEGLDGIEVEYPYYETFKAEAVSRYADIARRNHLLISGGTDFHGDGRIGLADVKLSTEATRKIIYYNG